MKLTVAVSMLAIPAVVAIVAGCATDGSRAADYDERRAISEEAIQQTRQWIATAQPATVGWINYDRSDKFEYLNNQFVTIETSKGQFLIEVRNYCPDLSNKNLTGDQTDVRSRIGTLRANVDSVKGCVIQNIYSLQGVVAEGADDDE